MRIIRDYRECPDVARGMALAIGNFDGVHRGHQTVISAMIDAAGKRLPRAVMCFEPHPRRFFQPGAAEDRITPFAVKARLLREMGVEFLFAQRFNREFSELGAEDFIRALLMQTLRVRQVVVGYDFVFGHRRGGDAESLVVAGKREGFGVQVLEAHCIDGEKCASSTIRALLKAGNMPAAAAMLGRDYTIAGRVCAGQQRGRQLGFPTANLYPPQGLLPHYGVYAVRARVEGVLKDGVANLGVKPTFGEHRPCLEVHLFDFTDNLYGKRLEVALLAFLRPEQRFEGLEALKAQIRTDSDAARRHLHVA